MILACLAALAQEPRGLMLMVRDGEGLLAGAPQVAVADASGKSSAIGVTDDGTEADMSGGDGVWSGAGRDLVGPEYDVTLTDGARTWVGRLTAPNPREPTLSFAPTAEGGLVLVDARPPSSGPNPGAGGGPGAGGDPGAPAPGEGGERGGSGPSGGAGTGAHHAGGQASSGTVAGGEGLAEWLGSRSYLGGWLGALALLGWLLAGGHRGAADPSAVPGARPRLRGEGLVWVEGDSERLVRALAASCRVVLAGRPPAIEVPHGTVFPVGPGRVAIDDVLASLKALRGRGTALVVVVTGRVEGAGGLSHRAALEALASRIPHGIVVYVFGGESPQFRVADDGTLVPVEPVASA